MRLEAMNLPPVTPEFYETLLKAFPPLDSRLVTENTSMIYVQRIAAQQEVIHFIANAVQKDVRKNPEPEPVQIEQRKPTWIARIKAILFRK